VVAPAEPVQSSLGRPSSLTQPRAGTRVARITLVEPGTTGPLVPELRDAELTLEHALAEACAAQPASKADTGELIKVEEVLQIAGEAAKRAISLRRRRGAERWAIRDAETAASLGATHRTFTDARGIWWDVFAVYPESRQTRRSQLQGTFQQGWLCFDSGTEKRRLSPIPEDWRTVSDEALEQLAHRAEVASRRGRPRKDSRPERGRTSD
jgi:hypothetical protein